MRRLLEAPRLRGLLGLLLCLVGVATIVACYFDLPLYAPLFSIYPITGWEWVSELITNMGIQGMSPGFIFGATWALIPLVAAVAVGSLGIARVAFAKPLLAPLYQIICLLGGFALALTLFIVTYGASGPRLGALGEAAGYALCFWGDHLMREKQPALATIWDEQK